MLWPPSISAPRIVAAKAGVPMKTRSSPRLEAVVSIVRPPSGSGGGCRYFVALCLGELAQDHPPLQRGDVIDKEDAVEVVNLVLQASREQPLHFHFADLVLIVEVAQADLGRTGDLCIVLRQGQAALVAHHHLG